jgi:hypothetical protein
VRTPARSSTHDPLMRCRSGSDGEHEHGGLREALALVLNPLGLGGHSENDKLPVLQGLPSVSAGVPRYRDGILPPHPPAPISRSIV